MTDKLFQLADYISKTNPQGVARLAAENGFPVPRSIDAMPGFIYQFIEKNKEEGYKKLIEIHPDKDLILASMQADVSASNFIGDSAQSSSGSGSPVVKRSVHTDLLIVVVICLILLAMLTR